jgi:NAD(P)-dependent dehydrogenase (short-subunit alcohol dehydrogenase family)
VRSPGLAGDDRRGRIVNIANGGGATMLPYFSAYVTSKTALIRFSECLAFEVKDHGIAVFAMGPGTVRTAMSEYSLNSPEGRTWLPCSATSSRRLRPATGATGGPPGRLCLRQGRCPVGTLRVPPDDLDRMIEEAREIEAGKLYSLQVQRL